MQETSTFSTPDSCLQEILAKLDPLAPCSQDYDEPPPPCSDSPDTGGNSTRPFVLRRDAPSKDLLLLTSPCADSTSSSSSGGLKPGVGSPIAFTALPRTDVTALRPLRLVPRMGTRLEARSATTGPTADLPPALGTDLEPLLVRPLVCDPAEANRARLKPSGGNPMRRIVRKARVGPVPPPPPPAETNTDSSSSLYEKIDDNVSTRRSGGPYEPLSPEIGPPAGQGRKSGDAKGRKHSHAKAPRVAWQRSATLDGRVSESASVGANGKRSRSAKKTAEGGGGHLYDLYDRFAQVMYTTPTNLVHTMLIQQQLFTQQMQHHKHRRRSNNNNNNNNLISRSNSNYEGISSLPGEKSADGGPNDGVADVKGTPMEWVVKRRADGSRYITRRPVR